MRRTTPVLVRGTLLLLAVAAVGAAAAAGGHPAVLRAATSLPELVQSSGQAPQALASLALLGAAAALTLAWSWLLAAVLTCLGDELRAVGHRGARPAPSALRPRLVRLLVGGVVGSAVALTVTPAHATPDQRIDPIVLAGLLLPDRPSDRPSTTALPDQPVAQAPPPSTVTVAAGDTLWGLAEQLLPDDADAEAVDQAWRALHAANEHQVGPDPDLIVPGTVLAVPTSLEGGAGR